MNILQAIILLSTGLLTATAYLRHRDLLYPPVLQGTVWTCILLLYVLCQEALIPLSPGFYWIVLVNVALFGAGAYVATRGLVPGRSALPAVPFAHRPLLRALLFWIPLLGLGPYLLSVLRLGQDGPFDNVYQNIRVARLLEEDASGGGVLGLLGYLVPVAYLSLILQTFFAGYRTERLRYVTTVAVVLTYALFTTGRSSLILVLTAIVGVLLITRRISALKAGAAAVAAILTVFAAGAFMVRQLDGGEADLATNLRHLYELFVWYTLGSLPAFDLYLQAPLDPEWGRRTFRTLLAVLSKLGMDVDVAPLVQEYELVPFPTNVYTYFQPYYTDFGAAGLVAAPLLLGFLHGHIYRQATQGHAFFMLLYALSLYPLVMQFFQDQYFSLFSFWIQLTLVLFFYFHRLRLLPPRDTLADVERGVPSEPVPA